MMTRPTFGQWLRRQRGTVSLRDLGLVAKLDYSRLSRLERGLVAPTLRDLFIVARVFHLSAAKIVAKLRP
jgi:transcriptional regulator with XRE-family HTH domain